MITVNKKLLNVCTPILNQLIHRLLPETLNTIIILAGFLTYFAFEHPSHFHSKQWIRSLAKDIDEAYSSGPVPVFTPDSLFHHMIKTINADTQHHRKNIKNKYDLKS